MRFTTVETTVRSRSPSSGVTSSDITARWGRVKLTILRETTRTRTFEGVRHTTVLVRMPERRSRRRS